MKRVLVVDDDARTRRVIEILLARMELEATGLGSAEEALTRFGQDRYDLVMTDLKMPRMNGIEFLRALRHIDSDVPVIVLTAHGTVPTAVEAMKLGAFDYVQKPFDLEALELLVRKALDVFRSRLENQFLREQLAPASGTQALVGESPAIRDVVALVENVAPTRAAVLITGETGTGKELVARAIHARSPRQAKLFVPINCAAIPGDLLESELFGHVRGAFSGATAARVGKFQAADEGTLFLDEIGDMEYRLQAKLLRVLQEGLVEPVGSNRRIAVDVRIVSSTNRTLEEAVREGRFREDLFYRLNVFRIHLPPLRERPGDVVLLARVFLGEFARELGKAPLALSAEAARLVEQYAWPGNVRELHNLMERVAVLSPPGEVGARAIRAVLPSAGEVVEEKLDLEAALLETERRLIVRALAATGGSKVEAAKLLGIGERTLWTKLKRHGL